MNTAGLGAPPPELDATRACNQSRMMAYLDCPRRETYTYAHNRVPDRDYTALTIGSQVHTLREELSNGTPAATLASEFVPACDDNFCEDLPEVLLAFTDLHPDHPEVIAAEQGFWVLINKTLLLGRFDAITEIDGKVYNCEIKTVGKGTDTAAFLEWRKTHPQEILYNLAGQRIYGDRWGGTYYELWHKNPKPRRASGGKSLEERLEEWPNTLFTTYLRPHQTVTGLQVLRLEDLALYASLEIQMAAKHDTPDRYGARQNHNACMSFGRPMCPYFRVCHEGLPLESIDFTDRKPDYVDQTIRAMEANDG